LVERYVSTLINEDYYYYYYSYLQNTERIITKILSQMYRRSARKIHQILDVKRIQSPNRGLGMRTKLALAEVYALRVLYAVTD